MSPGSNGYPVTKAERSESVGRGGRSLGVIGRDATATPQGTANRLGPNDVQGCDDWERRGESLWPSHHSGWSRVECHRLQGVDCACASSPLADWFRSNSLIELTTTPPSRVGLRWDLGAHREPVVNIACTNPDVGSCDGRVRELSARYARRPDLRAAMATDK